MHERGGLEVNVIRNVFGSLILLCL